MDILLIENILIRQAGLRLSVDYVTASDHAYWRYESACRTKLDDHTTTSSLLCYSVGADTRPEALEKLLYAVCRRVKEMPDLLKDHIDPTLLKNLRFEYEGKD